MIPAFIIATLSLLSPAARAFSPVPDSSGTEPSVEYTASVFGYWVEGEDFFALPILTADIGDLHLEGRYNYEDLRTGSLFAGWNIGFGSDVEVLLTPLAGVAFGRTTGLIPGLEAEVYYDILGFTLESEYVFDLEDAGSNFFYMWSELFVSPTDWLFAGLAAQRMRVVDTEVEVSKGLMVGGGTGGLAATFYAFDITEPESFVVLGLEWAP